MKSRVFYFVIVAATTVASFSGFIGGLIGLNGFRW
jgi:hypothetical protein